MSFVIDPAAVAALSADERARVLAVVASLRGVVAAVERPRSLEAWRLFVLVHAGPGLVDAMACELAAQGASVEPWEILRGLVRR